jgi:hypothetical protein
MPTPRLTPKQIGKGENFPIKTIFNRANRL